MILECTSRLDHRSLAAFRCGIGLTILVDLLLRSRDLVAFYTDVGLMPRPALTGYLARDWNWSLHLVNGTPGFQVLLFLSAAVFAGMLAIGYRTRLATVASWLLLVSLHSRNPLIVNAGDTYLALLTFWGIFLPLGKTWSLDAKFAAKKVAHTDRNHTVEGATISLASFALCLQKRKGVRTIFLTTGGISGRVRPCPAPCDRSMMA